MKTGSVALALALWSVFHSRYGGDALPAKGVTAAETSAPTPQKSAAHDAGENGERIVLPTDQGAPPPAVVAQTDYRFRVLSPAGAAVANAKITVERGEQRSEYSADVADIARIPRIAFDGK